MLTNDDLKDAAAKVERQARDLAKFFAGDPTIPPLEAAQSACELDRLLTRLNKLTIGVRASCQDDPPGNEG